MPRGGRSLRRRDINVVAGEKFRLTVSNLQVPGIQGLARELKKGKSNMRYAHNYMQSGE